MALRSLFSAIGGALRETGQALDRVGSRLQGNASYLEQLNLATRVAPFKGVVPAVSQSAFVAPNATLIGAVQVGENSSVWYGAVLRGDVNSITVGSHTNLQDRVVVHSAKLVQDLPTRVGDRVTVESGAILHACTLKNDSFVGLGATVLDGAVIGEHSMVAPGSVVKMNQQIPNGQLWAGAPAKYVRDLTAEEKKRISDVAAQYESLAAQHNKEASKSPDQVLADVERRAAADQRHEDFSSKIGHSA